MCPRCPISTLPASSILIVWFLNNRTTTQITLLNRLILLLVCSALLGCSGYYLLNFFSYCFNAPLKSFMDSYYSLLVIFLLMKWFTTLVLASYLALTMGRLLLFTSPAVYYVCNPRIGADLGGIMSICISCPDKVFNQM